MTSLIERLREAVTVLDEPFHHEAIAQVMLEAAAALESSGEWVDPECVCRGNWRLIVKECQDLFGRKYRYDNGDEYIFYGIVHADDDYYYGMIREGKSRLLSCVGSIEDFGFTLISDAAPPKDAQEGKG